MLVKFPDDMAFVLPKLSFNPNATDPAFAWMAVGPDGIGKFGPTLESVVGLPIKTLDADEDPLPN